MNDSEMTERFSLLYDEPLRMDAYYYGFTPTGNPYIDAILSAVAWAGKGSHHTEFWSDPTEYGPVDVGESYVSVIQKAAEIAARHMEHAPLPTIDELLDAIGPWVFIDRMRCECDPKSGWRWFVSLRRQVGQVTRGVSSGTGATRHEAIRAACEEAMQQKEAQHD